MSKVRKPNSSKPPSANARDRSRSADGASGPVREGGQQEQVAMVDAFRRPMHDLRISITDRCNFRCVYCMPKEVFGRGYQFLKREEILTYEEIARLARIFVQHGVEKIRLTGGEPTVRADLPKLIEMLTAIPDLKDLTLTTNGSRLVHVAQPLKEAGLKRINVSLDSLEDEVFRSMNDVDFPVRRVLDGIEAAHKAGLSPVKINVVVKKGINDHTIVDMARYFRGTGHIVRYIEFMDVGHQQRLADGSGGDGQGDRGDDRPRVSPGAGEIPVSGRGGQPLPLQGWGRRDRHHHLGLSALLRRLHAGPAVR